MRLSEDKNSWLASYEELQSLIGLLAISNNPLAIITGQMTPSDAEVKEVWNKYEAIQQDLLRTMLTTLASPMQTIHLAWTIGDFHYQRVTLSRQAGEKEFVWLAQQPQGELYQLQKAAGEEINLLLNDILMINSLGDENRSQTLGTPAVLGLLGVTELMRQHYHQSMLNHQASNNSLTAEQLQTILNAATQIDFRWPACFWEKNLPLDIKTLAGQIPDAIQELITEGWLKSASSGQFELTENALFMAEEMINERAKVSITIASTDGQEIMLQDSILLLRGPQNLWLYYILGKQGGVGQVGASGWKELSEALLTPPQVPAQVFQSEAMTADNNPVKFCSHCGKDIIPGTRFCGSCGAAL